MWSEFACILYLQQKVLFSYTYCITELSEDRYPLFSAFYIFFLMNDTSHHKFILISYLRGDLISVNVVCLCVDTIYSTLPVVLYLFGL